MRWGKKKFYVVWHGVSPGIYTSWTDCKLQINGFEGAIYKSFDTQRKPKEAYNTSPYLYIQQKKDYRSGSFRKRTDRRAVLSGHDTVLPLPPEVPAEALAVDAACSGNPGPMEYRGVYLRTGETVFHFGPVYGTNNIGEFLAIVHALALMEQKKYPDAGFLRQPKRHRLGQAKALQDQVGTQTPVQKLSIK